MKVEIIIRVEDDNGTLDRKARSFESLLHRRYGDVHRTDVELEIENILDIVYARPKE